MKSSNHLTGSVDCVCVSGNSGGVLCSAEEIYSISDLSGLFKLIFSDNLICAS